MTLEKLNELLANGAITQEEFDELSKNIVKTPEPTPTPDPTPPAPAHDPIDLGELDKIVQSRVDKALAAERKQRADLEKKYRNLQQAKLTEEELKKIEDEEREKALAEREKALADKENRLFAVKAIKEAGLDDGSDTSLSIVDFVMGEDETIITTRVKAFKDLFDKAVTAEVNKRFKENGYTPKQGTNLNGGRNPYTKEQFSLTEQMALEINNPELAKQLKAAAGVK